MGLGILAGVTLLGYTRHIWSRSPEPGATSSDLRGRRDVVRSPVAERRGGSPTEVDPPRFVHELVTRIKGRNYGQSWHSPA
jgi:hypothetical protein